MTLIALNANMRQTHCQVILQQALNHTASVDLLQCEVNCQLVDQVKSISSHIIVKNKLHMSFRYNLDSTVLYELDQSSEEYLPALFVLFLVGDVLADQ